MPDTKDYLLETLYALRWMYWAMNATHAQRDQIEQNIQQHKGAQP